MRPKVLDDAPRHVVGLRNKLALQGVNGRLAKRKLHLRVGMMVLTPLQIYSRPAWTASNPYPGLLADALESNGANVLEFGRGSGVPTEQGTVVFHWPDEFFTARSLKECLGSAAYLTRLAVAKLFRRQKIVWVGHNLQPHNRGCNLPWLRKAFFRYVDAVIFLSQSSRDLFLEIYPVLADKPYIVIRHGHYKRLAVTPCSLPSTSANRPVRLALTGQIQRYKAPDLLVKALEHLPDGSAQLLIAGACPEPALKRELERYAARSAKIALRLAFQTDAEIEEAIDSSDATIFPYRHILNSGSALMSLSRARPVIAPRAGAFVDLLDDVGAEWLWLYDGEIDQAKLAAAIAWVARTKRLSPPDLSAHEWDSIGSQIAGFFHDLQAA